MSNPIYTPNSNGKYEFMFERGIGENYRKTDRFSYLYAQNIFEEFITMFGVKDEPIIFEGDIKTLTAILAGFLEDYGNVFCGSDRDLNDWSARQKERPDPDLK